MKTAVLNSFLKFYVIGSTGIDLFGIAHVKVEVIPVLKIYAISILGNSPLLHKHCMVSISLTNVMGCCIVSFQNKTFDILKSKGV